MHEIHSQRLADLKKQKKQLSEKVECAEKCQFDKWTYLTGIQLSASCPMDCPLNEIKGQMKYKTSVAALETYNSYFEIRDIKENKEKLKQLNFQIREQEEMLREPSA